MRKALFLALFFFGGLLVTYVAVVAGLLWHMELNRIPDRDGGMTMGIIFIIGPIAALHGGLIAALAVPIWLRRRNRWPPATRTADAPRWPPHQRALLAAAISGIGAFLLTTLAIRIPDMTFRTYEAALLVSLSPYGFGLAAAGIAALLVLHRARRGGT